MAAVNPPLTANERATRSVFVGNIPYEATEEQLKDIFAQVGPVVSFRLVYDRETGKPKGYGFCEYQDVETAQSAMRNLNNYDFGGRPLRVGVAAGETNKDEMKSLQQAVGAAVIESPYGDTVEPEKAPEAISKAVASLPPEQMYELMKQMKLCIQNNPNEARNMLLQNPQLAYALLQAQIVMKIVDPQVALAMLYRQSDQIPPLLPTSDNKRPANAQPMDTSAAPGFSPKPMSTNAPNSSAPNLMGLNSLAPNSTPSSMAPNSMGGNTSLASAMGMSSAGPGQNFGGPMGQAGPSNMMGGPHGRGFPGDQRGPGGGEGGRPGGRPPGLLGNAPGDVNLSRPGGPPGPPDRRDPRNMDTQGAPMDPAHRGMDQRLPGMDPRGMDPRGGPGMDRRGPGPGMDRGMDPRGMDQRDRGMDPRGGGGGMEMRGGMDPRGGGMDPRGGPPRGGPPGGGPPVGGPPGGGARPGPPVQRPAGGDMGGGAPGQSPGQGGAPAQDKEKAALIMQVLQLTDQQIAMLPPDQRQSILILKEQIARSGGQGGM